MRPFSTRQKPLERSHREFANGFCRVENGLISKKLWPKTVGGQNRIKKLRALKKMRQAENNQKHFFLQPWQSGCKINRFIFKINRFILYQTNIFPKWMVLVFRLKVFITFAARIRFWRNQNRWKALGVSFPTVFVASKTDPCSESYEHFKPKHQHGSFWKNIGLV